MLKSITEKGANNGFVCNLLRLWAGFITHSPEKNCFQRRAVDVIFNCAANLIFGYFDGWKIPSSLCLCCNPIALTQPPLAVSIKERRLVPPGFWMNAVLSRKHQESACFNFWWTKLSAINLSFGFTLHQTGSNEAKKGWKIDQGRLSTWEESPPQAAGPLSWLEPPWKHQNTSVNGLNSRWRVSDVWDGRGATRAN